MGRYIKHNHENDGIDRRGFLNCMAWAGTGVVYALSGGVLRGQPLHNGDHGSMDKDTFSFVQISDSHIGFNKEANQDVIATLEVAVARINALPTPPAFVFHTGDLSHLSKPSEFDTLDKVLQTAKAGRVFYVPGEHDVLADNGKQYLERYGKGTKGSGWFSFDQKGVHFIGLVNVLDLKASGLGSLGHEQLEWLEDDVKGLSASTPVVVFAHMPLWTIYADWGWGTDDGAQALGYLKRFGSVTVLNGHIHQSIQKVEGNITFHTACSTAFPQPQPGMAPSPGPMKVPAEQLRSFLGLTNVRYFEGKHSLAIVDSKLDDGASGADPEVNIDNFTFTPGLATVPKGAQITWVNHDDMPHTVVSTTKAFASPLLDTGEKFSHTFDKPGEFPYYCSLHPRMTGKVMVREA
ncbi:MAG TPA: metallophosphoesterase [Bryobacteraceae bacterium]|nr:metallophosphoesterase [Bryobacteraceae bacterium]